MQIYMKPGDNGFKKTHHMSAHYYIDITGF